MKRTKLNKFVTTIVTIIILLAAAPLQILAQTANTGVITGVVKDQTGAVVGGATVKAINKGTNLERRTSSSDSGVFEIPQLTPGEYRLEVEASGFAKYVQETVTVNVLSRVTLDPELRPTGSAEQVTVTSDAAPLVETGKTDVSGVINQRQLESLPVNGRFH